MRTLLLVCRASQQRFSSYALVLLLLSFLLSREEALVPPLEAYLATETTAREKHLHRQYNDGNNSKTASSSENVMLGQLFFGCLSQHATVEDEHHNKVKTNSNIDAKSSVWTLRRGRVSKADWKREGDMSGTSNLGKEVRVDAKNSEAIDLSAAPRYRVTIEDPFENDWDPASTVSIEVSGGAQCYCTSLY